jgi:hypothetical protein
VSTIDVRDAAPIFDIVEGGYYVGFWYLAGRKQDFLGMLFRNPGDTSLQFRYRFRYYEDDKIFFDETDDVKNTYHVDFTDKTEDESIAAIDDIVRDLIHKGYVGSRLPWLVNKRSWRRIVRGDNRVMIKALQAMPFAHFKQMPSTKGGN